MSQYSWLPLRPKDHLQPVNKCTYGRHGLPIPSQHPDVPDFQFKHPRRQQHLHSLEEGIHPLRKTKGWIPGNILLWRVAGPLHHKEIRAWLLAEEWKPKDQSYDGCQSWHQAVWSTRNNYFKVRVSVFWVHFFQDLAILWRFQQNLWLSNYHNRQWEPRKETQIPDFELPRRQPKQLPKIRVWCSLVWVPEILQHMAIVAKESVVLLHCHFGLDEGVDHRRKELWQMWEATYPPKDNSTPVFYGTFQLRKTTRDKLWHLQTRHVLQDTRNFLRKEHVWCPPQWWPRHQAGHASIIGKNWRLWEYSYWRYPVQRWREGREIQENRND